MESRSEDYHTPTGEEQQQTDIIDLDEEIFSDQSDVELSDSPSQLSDSLQHPPSSNFERQLILNMIKGYFLGVCHLVFLPFNYLYLPSLQINQLILGRFPIKFTPLNQIQWRYWLIMFSLSLCIFYSPQASFIIQRSINYLREICHCDLIWLIRRSDLVEGATIFLNQDKSRELNYLTCRYLCPS